jgi:glycosyltransferase involved in cell wall biosynthesis
VKVAFVTPRYGPQVIGGAEAAARQLAEHLVAETAWQAEVYSTCALDPRTWADELAPGDAEIGGVTVHRFAGDHGRLAGFPLLDARLRRSPQRASMAEARQWVDANGPVSHELIDAVAGADADVVAFYPYLYHPTVAAIGRVTVPSVLHPAAHDEPPLYLPVFGRTFGGADAFCYHGTAERRLVERAFPVAARPQIELGLGVGPSAGTGRRGAEVLHLSDRPYIVSVGRVDEQKGSTMLSAYFAEYKLRHPGPLALVLIGPVSAPMAPHPDIVVTGTVSEADKWDIVHDAVVSVSPSALESFSLVVLEAWVDGVPVLVNGRCEPTMEHCRRSGGGLWFTSYPEFDAVLRRLIDDPQLRRSLGGRGRAYVEGHYRWPELIARYADFLERVVARGTRRTSGPVPVASSSRSA